MALVAQRIPERHGRRLGMATIYAERSLQSVPRQLSLANWPGKEPGTGSLQRTRLIANGNNSLGVATPLTV